MTFHTYVAGRQVLQEHGEAGASVAWGEPIQQPWPPPAVHSFSICPGSFLQAQLPEAAEG